jgi:hypothetical protein
MVAAEDWARERGSRYVSLNVNLTNERARRFVLCFAAAILRQRATDVGLVFRKASFVVAPYVALLVVDFDFFTFVIGHENLHDKSSQNTRRRKRRNLPEVPSMTVERRTVDLSGYPNLVVVYLGMRVNALIGLRMLIGLGPQIEKSVAARPPGLLRHESFLFSLFPPQGGMRQYWEDFESLERWTRSEPHRTWWKEFLGDSRGTGFWHETYAIRGGFEAIYDDMRVPMGLSAFAPTAPAKGGMFSARRRLHMSGDSPPPVVEER